MHEVVLAVAFAEFIGTWLLYDSLQFFLMEFSLYSKMDDLLAYSEMKKK